MWSNSSIYRNSHEKHTIKPYRETVSVLIRGAGEIAGSQVAAVNYFAWYS
jgi:hypothetical protein